MWFHTLLLGAPAILLASFIYSFIIVINPLVYLSFILYLLYLFCIVAILKIVTTTSHNRSQGLSVLMGTLLGLIGLYASWVFFMDRLFANLSIRPDLFALFKSPETLYEMIQELGNIGWYTVKGSQVKGGLLWGIWIVEALGIVGAGLVGGVIALHEEVYCEKCKAWAETLETDALIFDHGSASTETIEAAASGHVERLLELPRGEMLAPHIKVNLKRCKTCSNTTTLDFDQVTWGVDKNGNPERNASDASPVFILEDAQYHRFMERLSQNSQEIDAALSDDQQDDDAFSHLDQGE